MKVNDQAEYRDVTVGINNKIFAQILSGLNEGDEIVLGQSFANKQNASALPILGQPGSNLRPGMRL